MGTDTQDSKGPLVLWHYTVVERLQRIVHGGEIRPATVGGPKRAKPAVWFSSNPVWEPTANRLWRDDIDGRTVRLSKDQTYVLGGGLARIGVAPDVAPHDWKAYRHLSGISADQAKAIYDEAVGAGSRPGEWFATFDIVPRSKWLAVEIWDNEQWTSQRMAAPDAGQPG